MNPSTWDEHKRDAIAQSLENIAKFLGRQEELRGFIEFMDSTDMMDHKPTQEYLRL